MSLQSCLNFIFVIMNVENSIKSLLYQYDCVIVPDFGGFVAKRKSAVFHPWDYSFEPPKKIVGFNSDLVHTDGLLATHLTKRRHISYDEAVNEIADTVNSWNALLNTNQTVEIQDLGSFRKVNGHVEFTPSLHQNFAFESFGLAPVKANYILRGKSVAEETKTSKAWVSYAVAVAFAVIVGISGFFANTELVQPQLSSFFPVLSTEKIITETAEKPIAPVIVLDSENPAVTENTSIEIIAQPTSEINSEIPASIPVEDVVEATPEIDLSVKKYQVIGGSFKVYSQAMEHQAKLKRDGFERAVIIGKVGSYFMVAFDTFHDHQAALEFQRELQKKGMDVFMRP